MKIDEVVKFVTVAHVQCDEEILHALEVLMMCIPCSGNGSMLISGHYLEQSNYRQSIKDPAIVSFIDVVLGVVGDKDIIFHL